MELVDLLKEEIKKLASEDDINVNKLNEYTRIYERLKMFQVTSVREMEIMQEGRAHQFEGYNIATPALRVGGARPRDDLGSILDIFKEAIHNQNKPHKKDEIDDYIFWVRFLKDIRDDITKYWKWEDGKEKAIKDLDKMVVDVCTRTLQLMRKKLEDNIAEKNDNEEIGTETTIPKATMI